MAIYGNDQQQTTLATLKHTQGDGCVVLWLIVVSVAIVVLSSITTIHKEFRNSFIFILGLSLFLYIVIVFFFWNL